MIEGKRVVIRPMQYGDEESLYNWWNDGRAMEYSGLKYGFLLSKEALRNRIVAKNVECTETWPEERMFMICKRDSHDPIGDISYRAWNKRIRSAELGIEIAVNERGKGYGYDALSSFIDFMFKALNLNRIELTTMSDNVAAQHLYEKLGFKHIGLIRDGSYDSRTGAYSDTAYMDLLRREWKL